MPTNMTEFKIPMPRFSKKIGMNLGIEYLVRSGLVREFMTFPCSIFVKSADGVKVAITINKANTGHTEHCTQYSVRNWFISDCDEKQPIPSMHEEMVQDVDLFHSPSVILKGFSPLYFDCNSVEWKRNRGNNGHPMPDYMYEDYFHKMFSPIGHKVKRETFLWSCFTEAYIPSIKHMIDDDYGNSYIPSSIRNKARSTVHLKQQKLVERNFRTIWWAWQKWKKFMLFDSIPGELIFMRDYSALAN
jgi:hypothetical protein